MRKVLVVNNINAGRKQAIMCKKSILDFLLRSKIDFQFIDVDELNDFNVEDIDTIIAVGGDGTVNKVVPYVINSDKVIGIIPCGTANLLAAKLGIASDIDMALKIIENGNIAEIDVLKINQENYSVLRVGFGYDSDIICKTLQSWKNSFGYFAYFIAGIIYALRLKKKRYKLSFDGNELAVDATCLIVANAGNMYKNVVSVSKDCKLNDGVFDVFVLTVQNPILYFFEFLKIIFGNKYSNDKVMYFQCSSLNIENDFCTCHIDGEKTKIKDNIYINIVPKSVKVFGIL